MTAEYVYVAGPYTSDPEGNTRRMIAIGQLLVKAGCTPFIPHLYHYWDAQIPGSYEQWMALCLAWLERCTIFTRDEGDSPGADREEARAQQLALRFASLDELLGEDWEDRVAQLLDASAKPDRLPKTRNSRVFKLDVGGFETYVIVGFDANDKPAEVFIRTGKVGSTLKGLCQVVGKLVSMMIKHGVPPEVVAKALHVGQFEPSGIGHAGNEEPREYESLTAAVAEVLRRTARGKVPDLPAKKED